MTNPQHMMFQRISYRTYEIAAELDKLTTRASEAFFAELVEDEGDLLWDLTVPWQRDTALHRLARSAWDRVFWDETGGPFISHTSVESGRFVSKRFLSVDVALMRYGFAHKPFEIPHPEFHETRRGNVTTRVEIADAANACLDYFGNDLRVSAIYEDLLHVLGEEVFYVLFRDRHLLWRLHLEIADRLVTAVESQEIPHDFARLFTRRGRLRRVAPPEWAKRAVFHRDGGRCCKCHVDLTGVISVLSRENFDHMVPLAEGGLNDVTNLQLMCQSCNNKKSRNIEPVSDEYARWF